MVAVIQISSALLSTNFYDWLVMLFPAFTAVRPLTCLRTSLSDSIFLPILCRQSFNYGRLERTRSLKSRIVCFDLIYGN